METGSYSIIVNKFTFCFGQYFLSVQIFFFFIKSDYTQEKKIFSSGAISSADEVFKLKIILILVFAAGTITLKYERYSE